MDSTSYTALSRQLGLRRELDVIANNIANANTTGFRREDLVFSEFIRSSGSAGPSVSMVQADAHRIVQMQGGLEATGGSLDFAIEGAGFFQIERNGETFLSRAGHFMTDAEGLLVNGDGNRVLDAGGAPVFIPPGAQISLGQDGTLSANGRPVGQIGLVLPADPNDLGRAGDNLLKAAGDLVPADTATLHQGMLESSNVNPIGELARLIEVQRRYEANKSFLDREDQRIKSVIQTLGRN